MAERPPLKSTSRATGQPGGLSMAPTIRDGLSNVASGMGTDRDRSSFNSWRHPLSNAVMITGQQIDAAYRGSRLIRKIHDIIPTDMTKDWRSWSADADVIAKVEAEEKRLKVRAMVREALRLARLRGGCVLVMGLPGNSWEPAPEGVGLGELKYLIPMTRDHLSLLDVDRDLESPNFNRPKGFRMTHGRTHADIHHTRTILFKGEPGSGIRTTSAEDDFWGHPLMEALNDDAMMVVAAVQAVGALIPELAVDIIGIPGLTDLVSTQEGEARLAKRLQASQTIKSMFRAVVRDAGSGEENSGEQWDTRQLRLTDVPETGRFLLQYLAGLVDIPMTRFMGSPPEGMNATGEGDEENYFAMVRGRQDDEVRPALERLDPYLLGSAGVAKAPEGTPWTFSPLKTSTPAEQAELDAKTAETFKVLKDTGLIQEDALAAVVVAVLSDRPTFPGLDAAVAKSTEDIPALAARELEAAAVQPVAANENGPRTVRGPTSPARVQRRVAARDADGLLMDADPRTLFISRRILNPQEVLRHFRNQGVENLMTQAELHVTQITSLNDVDWMKVPADWSSDRQGRLYIPPGGPRVVSHLGSYVVQEFASDELSWRFRRLVDAGIMPRWAEFKAHFSLVEDAGQQVDIRNLKPYTGRIVLGPEIFEEVI